METCMTDDEASGMESAREDERLLPHRYARRGEFKRQQGFRRNAAAVLASALLLCGCLGVWTLSGASDSAAPTPSARAPLTVRSLLESPELAEVATDNLMAMGKDSLEPVDRDLVRAHVSRRLQNISEELRRSYPQDHDKLSVLQLSEMQKESVLRVLRHYADSRMTSLAGDFADAVRESVQEAGDREHFKRRLSEKLEPRIGEMRKLSEEMFPGSGKNFAIDLEQLVSVRNFEKWHDRLTAQQSSPLEATARRLGSASDVDGGVRAQAQTFFQTVEGHLGDSMPKAPARMLSFSIFSNDTPPPAPSSYGSQSGGEVTFMDCLMKAVPNPMSVCECIANNVQEVMRMMMQFVQGKSA